MKLNSPKQSRFVFTQSLLVWLIYILKTCENITALRAVFRWLLMSHYYHSSVASCLSCPILLCLFVPGAIVLVIAAVNHLSAVFPVRGDTAQYI